MFSKRTTGGHCTSTARRRIARIGQAPRVMMYCIAAVSVRCGADVRGCGVGRGPTTWIGRLGAFASAPGDRGSAWSCAVVALPARFMKGPPCEGTMGPAPAPSCSAAGAPRRSAVPVKARGGLCNVRPRAELGTATWSSGRPRCGDHAASPHACRQDAMHPHLHWMVAVEGPRSEPRRRISSWQHVGLARQHSLVTNGRNAVSAVNGAADATWFVTTNASRVRDRCSPVQGDDPQEGKTWPILASLLLLS